MHLSLDPTLIYNARKAARSKWKSVKKKSSSICHQFLTKWAEYLAAKNENRRRKGAASNIAS